MIEKITKENDCSNILEIGLVDEVFLISSKEESRKRAQNITINKDLHNILFLIFLYFLQGIPLGLAGSLPFILGARNVSYADQGTFSIAFWPFALKILWAPIVDSIFIKKIGRRKSWLIPMQYIIGILMVLFSNHVHQMLEINQTTDRKDIYLLTIIFFILTFFAATQDIAVDGWGLTILSKENISWSSTCNSVGQTAGWFVGNIVFLVIQSANFSNNYIRPSFNLPSQKFGIVTVEDFMKFFGIVFIIATTLVFFFKKEIESDNSVEDTLTLKQTYKLVFQIISLPNFKKLTILLLTSKLAFGVQSIVYLKLIEKGVSRESLGLLALPLTPFEIALPLIISRFTNGPRPLSIFLNTYPFRIFSSSLMVIWVYLTPNFRNSNGSYGLFYFTLCIFLNAFNSIWNTTQSVTMMAFFTRISDKTVGGTYMTLLNTISNIGSSWPSTISLYIIDLLSTKECSFNKNMFNISYSYKFLINSEKNSCSDEKLRMKCTKINGNCEYKFDAFYMLSFVLALIGFLWAVYFRKIIKKLQSYPKNSWKLNY